MQSSFVIGRVAGIRIGIHSTWLFAFLLISWSLAASYYPSEVAGLGLGTYLLMPHERRRNPHGCADPCSGEPALKEPLEVLRNDRAVR